MKNLLRYKKILMLIVLIYVAYILISQQKVLSSYGDTEKYYEKQINEMNEYNISLLETKDNITSAEYIEKFARDELGMYYPNERVYLYNN